VKGKGQQPTRTKIILWKIEEKKTPYVKLPTGPVSGSALISSELPLPPPSHWGHKIGF